MDSRISKEVIERSTEEEATEMTTTVITTEETKMKKAFSLGLQKPCYTVPLNFD